MMLFLVVGVLSFKSRIGKQYAMQKRWNNSRRVEFGAPFIFYRLNVKRIFFILLTETVFRKNTEFNLLKIGRTNKKVLQARMS